jgi:hypothetical protein
MTGYSRKYANRLLTGSRKFKGRKGRGATYTEQDKAMLMRLWREVGRPCTTYFQANIDEWLREIRICVAHIPDDTAAHMLSMGASSSGAAFADGDGFHRATTGHPKPS